MVIIIIFNLQLIKSRLEAVRLQFSKAKLPGNHDKNRFKGILAGKCLSSMLLIL